MMLSQWATRWNIPQQAIDELRLSMGAIRTDTALLTGQSEAAVQTQVRLEASKAGARLFRNNVGVLKDEHTGRPVRFGIANDSAQMNKKIKSSDLIGITPLIVQPHHVGNTHGIFTAIEVKNGSWKWSGTPREVAQMKFIELINGLGGIGAFSTGQLPPDIDS